MLNEVCQYCSVEGHQPRQIIGICIKEKCSLQRGICYMCQQLSHQNHSKKELLDFVSVQCWKQEREQEYQKIISLLSDYKKKLNNCFRTVHKLLEEEYHPSVNLTTLPMQTLNKKVNNMISLNTILHNLEKKIGIQVGQLVKILQIDTLKLDFFRGKDQTFEQQKNPGRSTERNNTIGKEKDIKNSPYSEVKQKTITCRPPRPNANQEKKEKMSIEKPKIKFSIPTNIIVHKQDVSIADQDLQDKFQLLLKRQNVQVSLSISKRQMTLPGSPAYQSSFCQLSQSRINEHGNIIKKKNHKSPSQG